MNATMTMPGTVEEPAVDLSRLGPDAIVGFQLPTKGQRIADGGNAVFTELHDRLDDLQADRRQLGETWLDTSPRELLAIDARQNDKRVALEHDWICARWDRNFNVLPAVTTYQDDRCCRHQRCARALAVR